MTDRELRLYESAPWSPEAWSAPVELCPLIATRLVFVFVFLSYLKMNLRDALLVSCRNSPQLLWKLCHLCGFFNKKIVYEKYSRLRRIRNNMNFISFRSLVNSSRQSDLITFSVRCGTSEGVVTHHLKVETHRDLANWARTIVQGCHTSVMLQRELSMRKYIKCEIRRLKRWKSLGSDLSIFHIVPQIRLSWLWI